MLKGYLAVGVAGSLLLATAALAAETSTTSTSTPTTSGSASNVSVLGDWRTSKVVGLTVYNNQNEKVGSINDLLMDKSGKIKAVVLGVGGFLGVGEHLVAVSFDKLKFSDQPVPSTTASGSAPSGGITPPMSSTSTIGSVTTAPAATPPKPNPWYPDHAVFNATRDELKSMSEFKYSTE